MIFKFQLSIGVIRTTLMCSIMPTTTPQHTKRRTFCSSFFFLVSIFKAINWHYTIS